MLRGALSLLGRTADGQETDRQPARACGGSARALNGALAYSDVALSAARAIPIEGGAVGWNPWRSYSRRPGASAIKETYAPVGVACRMTASRWVSIRSPRPRRWWA